MNYKMDSIGQTIVEMVEKRHGKKGHPRIIFTRDRFEYIRTRLGTGDLFDKTFETVKKEADITRGNEPQKYEIYDGIRLLQRCRNVLNVIETCGIVYGVTGDEKYAARAAKELDAAARFPDWHPFHFLDVGEMCMAFAIGYDWLYDYLTDEQKRLYRNRIAVFGFLPAMDDFLDNPARVRSYRWYQDYPGDNWKLVCGGGESCAALAICDEDESGLSPIVLTYAFKKCHEFIRDAYVELDGSYVESLGYWSYATQYLARYSTALVTACGTDFDLTDTTGMRKTGYFPSMLSSNGFISFNFGDAGESCMSDPALLWVGHRFGQSDVSSIRAKSIREGRPAVIDMFWLYPDDDYDALKSMPLDYGCLNATNATFRTGWGDDDVFVGIHYGKNRVCHGHLDMGQFIVEYKNKRFFSDLGADNYNLPSYSTCYRHVSEGHNTITINHGDKAEGQKWSGETYISKFKSTESESFAAADMTSAYDAESVVRGIKLNKKTLTVTVQDEIRTKSASDNVFWFGHTKSVVEISDDGREALLTIDGVKMKAVLLADGKFSLMHAGTTEWSENQAEGQNPNEGYTRLTVHLNGKTVYTISVAILPAGRKPEEKFLPLSGWN